MKSVIVATLGALGLICTMACAEWSTDVGRHAANSDWTTVAESNGGSEARDAGQSSGGSSTGGHIDGGGANSGDSK